MKFDWNEFMNEDNKIAVHCKTEEEATDFCKMKFLILSLQKETN